MKEINQNDIQRMIEEEMFSKPSQKKEGLPFSNSIKKMIGEALLKEIGEMPYPQNNDPLKNCPQRYKNLRQLLDIILQTLSRLIDTYYETPDEDRQFSQGLKKEMSPMLEAFVAKMLEKIPVVWRGSDKETSAEIAPEKVEQPIFVVTGEHVISPQNIEYIIDSIDGEVVILKETKSNKLVKVEKNILNKWRK